MEQKPQKPKKTSSLTLKLVLLVFVAQFALYGYGEWKEARAKAADRRMAR